MEVRGDLEALLYVMTKLGAKFPLVGSCAPIPPIHDLSNLSSPSDSVSLRKSPKLLGWRIEGKTYMALYDFNLPGMRRADDRRRPLSAQESVMHSRSSTNFTLITCPSLFRFKLL